MRKTLPILALLSLAAASSAQTIILSPAALRGYTGGGGWGSNVSTGSLNSVLHTAATLYQNTSPVPGEPSRWMRWSGWRAEFDLSIVPQGSRITSAVLEARVAPRMVPLVQSVVLQRYTGTGTIAATGQVFSPVETFTAESGTLARIDVTQYLGTGRYAGFNFSPVPPTSVGSTGLLIWSDPKLTVTYAPVPEPSSLAALGLAALGLLRRRRKA